MRQLRKFLEQQLQLAASREDLHWMMPMPVFIQGPPGIGKTAVVNQLAAEHEMQLITIRAAALEPPDITGYPYQTKQGRLGYLLPEWLPIERDQDVAPTILFLDELNYAQPDVLRALQMVIDRNVHDVKLHDNVAIIGAGNHQEDNADVVQLASPLVSRLKWYMATPSLEAFLRWSFGILHPLVQGYLTASPESLYVAPTERGQQFPCPRMWMEVSACCYGLIIGEQLKQEVQAALGEATALSFFAKLPLLGQLTPLEQLLDGVCSEDTELQVIESGMVKHHLRIRLLEGEITRDAATELVQKLTDMNRELRQAAMNYIVEGREY